MTPFTSGFLSDETKRHVFEDICSDGLSFPNILQICSVPVSFAIVDSFFTTDDAQQCDMTRASPGWLICNA